VAIDGIGISRHDGKPVPMMLAGVTIAIAKL
jgi:hypothetical protein